MNKLAIDIISDKIKEIIDENYKTDICKPTFIISEFWQEDFDGYLLTLIHSDSEYLYSYRQSAFITLSTDLEETITRLYNRTM